MALKEFLAEWHNDSPTLLVHTSGSTGVPKSMLVEKRRMEASARITCDFLGLKLGDTALLCLSTDYIAGKMMVVRALTCGLQLVSVEPSGHPLASCFFSAKQSVALRIPLASSMPLSFAAMVPLQVYNSLQVPDERERLMQIGHLIIGGGAIDPELEQALADFPNHVWSTYGMTETLSHIALRRLNGPERSDWYTPFAGVGISLNAEGCLVIDAPAVCAEPLTTNDMAVIEDGRFRILGRKDNVICSGGLKIHIEEVERLLRAHVREPYLITKVPDERLGEAVVLLTTAAAPVVLADLQATCRRVLPTYWVPRHLMTVAQLPFTATGKPARAEAERLAQASL